MAWKQRALRWSTTTSNLYSSGLCYIPSAMANTRVCFGSSVNANTNITLPGGIRKCNNSAPIIKFTDLRPKSFSAIPSRLPPPKKRKAAFRALLPLMFDITVTYNWSLNTGMYICWSPNQRYVWIEKLQREEKKKKIEGRVPYFRNNFYRSQESQEKHLHDLSHTSREVSILSGCVSISSAEPVATEVTEGCVLQFGTRPNITFENVHFCIYSRKRKKKKTIHMHFSLLLKTSTSYLLRAGVTNLLCKIHVKKKDRRENRGRPTDFHAFHALLFFFFSWNQVND